MQHPNSPPARSGSSTGSCPGSISIAACWRRPRTRAIRCSSGCGSCRFRPTTSTNSSWCASPACKGQVREGIVNKSPDGLTPAEQLVRIGEAVGARERPAGALARAARGAGKEASSSSTAPSHQGGTDWLEDHFLASHLPGADAARDRSGASVPVHSQSRLHDRAAACARERRQGDERADPHAATRIDRFIRLPRAGEGGRARLITLEHATGLFIAGCFPATR